MIVILSAGFLAGNLTALWLCVETPSLWFMFGVLLVGSGLIFYPCSTARIAMVRPFLPAFACAFVYTSYAAAGQLADRLSPHLEGVDVDAVIRVASIPVQQGLSTRFDAKVVSSSLRLPTKLRLRWYRSQHRLQLGDTAAVTLRLKQPRGFINPGTFDYERYLFHNRIGASGYVRGHQWIKEPRGYRAWSDRWRGNIFQALMMYAQRSSNEGPILALAMGERGAMQKYHWQQLRMTGTSHLFAISGLHVGLVYGFAFFLFLRLWRHSFLLLHSWPAQKFAALMALAAAAAYAWLAGFSIPTQRALLMLSFVAAVFLLGRTITLLHGIAAALLLVVCFDPLQTLSVSFWLTFLACLMIAVCLSTNLTRPVWQRGVVVQLWLPVALLPAVFLFFGQATPLASLANLVAIPYVSFLLVPCILLAVMLLPLPFISDFLITQADRLFNLFWWLSEWLTSNKSFYWWHRPFAWTYPLGFLGAIGFIVSTRLPMKIAALALMLPLSASAPENKLSAGEFVVTFLDVGQALAAVVQTQNHNLLYDTGFIYSSGFDAGEQLIVPYLHKQMIHYLDALVVSHGDSDHSGGLPSVLQHFQPEQRWSSVSERFADDGFSPCQRGIAWSWDGVQFEFLHPPTHSMLQGNDASCVLKVSNHHHALLLTADIERQAEAQLLQNPQELPASLLLVPHHGSLTSSSDAFVRAVQPMFAIITSGWRNRFGLPKEEVVQRYHDMCATVINTANTGALSIHAYANDAVPAIVRIERRDQKRLWRLPATPIAKRKPHCRALAYSNAQEWAID